MQQSSLLLLLSTDLLSICYDASKSIAMATARGKHFHQ